MAPTMKLADYLFTRLRQLGIGAIHGVPGDFNLDLLDYVEPAGLQWVGNANELNAGYAADGYARIKGMGALITTFGVGELSALNAIAGAYAERAAVVHIVGTPGRATQDSRLLVHHTFNDGEYRRFAQMSAHITVAQASLRDPRTSPEQIDQVLMACMLHSRPVYIEVPVDLVAAPVSAERLNTPIDLPSSVPNANQDTAVAAVLEKMHAAKQPVILVDGESRALGIVDDLHHFIKKSGWPTWTSGFAKGLVDETLPNVHGIYRGKYSDSKVKSFIENSDLILCFGPHFSSTNSYGYTSIPKADITISFKDTEVKVGNQIYRDIPAKYAIARLLQDLDPTKMQNYDDYPDLSHDSPMSFSEISSDQKITQDKFWRLFANFVRPGDIILGETGTPGYGCRDIPLPQHTRMFVPATWLSIGYMLPAAQGAALAQRELINSSKYHDIKEARTILFIGDGSFQMTVQELGTIIRLNLDVVVVVINNSGYTIERAIHGLKQPYNDIASWRYLQAPNLFGAREDTYTASARTWAELEEVLKSEKLSKDKGLRMVEVFMDREDVPPGMLFDMMSTQQAKESQKGS